jgi:hypothetical protein
VRGKHILVRCAGERDRRPSVYASPWRESPCASTNIFVSAFRFGRATPFFNFRSTYPAPPSFAVLFSRRRRNPAKRSIQPPYQATPDKTPTGTSSKKILASFAPVARELVHSTFFSFFSRSAPAMLRRDWVLPLFSSIQDDARARDAGGGTSTLLP